MRVPHRGLSLASVAAVPAVSSPRFEVQEPIAAGSRPADGRRLAATPRVAPGGFACGATEEPRAGRRRAGRDASSLSSEPSRRRARGSAPPTPRQASAGRWRSSARVVAAGSEPVPARAAETLPGADEIVISSASAEAVRLLLLRAWRGNRSRHDSMTSGECLDIARARHRTESAGGGRRSRSSTASRRQVQPHARALPFEAFSGRRGSEFLQPSDGGRRPPTCRRPSRGKRAPIPPANGASHGADKCVEGCLPR